ncbi:DUF6326 family protein [Aquimarina sp. D1M17]|uniref:DUF6326 family protein n=1 Tax=Aquimarina acroporae TaxID=2937283 RepID=UPI0020BEB462|nr:DUF6326 family protein [Aquimarina acroporae]MCK8522964.1 DUF6326 family protein [Aquimarina acroporae]
MKINSITIPTLLSTLWVFILFNMIFRDLHQFLAIGYIEEMMALTISDTNMLLYGVILEIPILMVLLSRVLPNIANKWVNSIAAIIIMLGVISTLPNGDLDDTFFALIEIISFITIIRLAWKLPTDDLQIHNHLKKKL